MKTKFLFFHLLAMCVLLVSCSNDDVTKTYANDDLVYLSIKTQDQIKLEVTRGIHEANSFLQNDSIALYCENVYGQTENIKASKGTTFWTIASNIEVYEEPTGVYAVFPYGATLTGDFSVVDTTDVMFGFASTPATKTNPTATLGFYHALSRVSFSLAPTDANKGKTVEKVVIRNGGGSTALGTTGRLSPEANTFCHNLTQAFQSGNSDQIESVIEGFSTIKDNLSVPNRNHDARFTLTPNVVIDDDTLSFDFVTFPTTITTTNSVVIDITVDGETYSTDIPNYQWLSGRHYKYSIKVNASKQLTLTEPVVALWQPVEKDDDLTASTEPFGRAIDLGLSVMWASCNVGASAPEQVGDYFAWGETTTKGSFVGTYLNAHWKSGENQSQDIGQDISGTQYDAARAQWGGIWRMPTQAECEELINNCSSEWMTYNGSIGQMLTGPNGNRIFFPKSNVLYESGSMTSNEDGSIHVWTSTLGNANGKSNYALYMSVSNNSLYIGNNHLRYRGMVIRPVTNY